MQKSFSFNNSEIFYSVSGTGKPILFVHGYMSSSEIWESLTREFDDEFKVITVDLIGHGRSSTCKLQPDFSVYTNILQHVLDLENISACILVGHSLGGYVALDFLYSFPHKVSGIVLMHSHPFPDDEKRSNLRSKEAEMILSGKKDILISMNIHRSLYNDETPYMRSVYDKIRRIALNTSDQGCIFALEAMKTRDSKVDFLRTTNIPVMFILGKHDQYLPYTYILDAEFCNAYILILENSAHYGFLEETLVCTDELKRFSEFC